MDDVAISQIQELFMDFIFPHVGDDSVLSFLDIADLLDELGIDVNYDK